MALWTPGDLMGRFGEANFSAPSSTVGTQITASSTAGSKGSWTQLIASTAKEYHWLIVGFTANNASATITNVVVDIGIGAASSEIVLVPDLLVGSQPSITTDFAPHLYVFPIRVPSGSRLSARSASGPAGSQTCRVLMWLFGKNPKVPSWTGSKVTAYGITLSGDARGVAVTPGVSAAEGSWTQIVSSTGDRCEYIVPGWGMPQTTTVANQVYALDFGFGASSAEQALVRDILFMTDTSERVHGGWCMPIYADLPASTRLVARLSQHSTTAQAVDVALYGVS